VQQTGASRLGDDDLDALLADIEGNDSPAPTGKPRQPPPPAPRTRAVQPPTSQPGARSGFPSGSDTATGMRCSKCDLQVLCFDDHAWAADADYMFFRNFMPNVDKLRAKLRAKDGQRAYSCQCTWVTVETGAPHGVGSWFMARR